MTILSGSIVRVWAVLEQVLTRHEHELSKADRAMRIIRVDMKDAGILVGVRYKESLLGEVLDQAMFGEAQSTCNHAHDVAETCDVAVDTGFVASAPLPLNVLCHCRWFRCYHLCRQQPRRCQLPAAMPHWQMPTDMQWQSKQKP